MNAVEGAVVWTAGSLGVGWLFGVMTPINGMDDLKAEVSRLREQLRLDQVHEFVDNVISLDRFRTKSRKATTPSVWQRQDAANRDKEVRDAA